MPLHREFVCARTVILLIVFLRAIARKEALDSLSEKDREALLLWDAGQSYTEIANVLGLAVGAVGTTLARARQRLAEAYNERGKANVARR